MELDAAPRPADVSAVGFELHVERRRLAGVNIDVLRRDLVAIINDGDGVLPGGQRDRLVAVFDGLAVHKNVRLLRRHVNLQLAVLRVCRIPRTA